MQYSLRLELRRVQCVPDDAADAPVQTSSNVLRRNATVDQYCSALGVVSLEKDSHCSCAHATLAPYVSRSHRVRSHPRAATPTHTARPVPALVPLYATHPTASTLPPLPVPPPSRSKTKTPRLLCVSCGASIVLTARVRRAPPSRCTPIPPSTYAPLSSWPHIPRRQIAHPRCRISPRPSRKKSSSLFPPCALPPRTPSAPAALEDKVRSPLGSRAGDAALEHRTRAAVFAAHRVASLRPLPLRLERLPRFPRCPHFHGSAPRARTPGA
ncbi:hypothetical protein DFH09DRAFT_1286899 [Mycena vulgaris]|nr:hypothetical protein DFH09DRAFT_1286899 [Mycena vulgaris]